MTHLTKQGGNRSSVLLSRRELGHARTNASSLIMYSLYFTCLDLFWCWVDNLTWMSLLNLATMLYYNSIRMTRTRWFCWSLLFPCLNNPCDLIFYWIIYVPLQRTGTVLVLLVNWLIFIIYDIQVGLSGNWSSTQATNQIEVVYH